MRPHKDVEWGVAGKDGRIETWEKVKVSVLMDLRDELKSLNTLLHCPNFTDIPHILRRIQRNTTKRKRAKKKAAT